MEGGSATGPGCVRRPALQRSSTLARAQQAGMRLRLADTPEVAELPWEFRYDPRRDRFLAQLRRVGHAQASGRIIKDNAHYL